jgi:hypothetical protein
MEIEPIRARAEKQAQEKTACCWDLERERARLEQRTQKAELEESRSLTGCGSITR